MLVKFNERNLGAVCMGIIALGPHRVTQPHSSGLLALKNREDLVSLRLSSWRREMGLKYGISC